MRNIRLNFIPFSKQNFTVGVFRRKSINEDAQQGGMFYILPDGNAKARYEVLDHEAEGFEHFRVPIKLCLDVVSRRMYDRLVLASSGIDGFFIYKPDKQFNKRLHYCVERHPKGRKCVWIEPFFLKSEGLWGILVGFQFVVDITSEGDSRYKLDKDILIASGALNESGQSNTDFYIFKHNFIDKFIKDILPQLNDKLNIKFASDLTTVHSFSLKAKEYVFKDGISGNSAYFGLSRYSPLSTIDGQFNYEFIYKSEDRQFAVALLKGLRGVTHPNTFVGMEKFFKVPFSNEVIKGVPIKEFSQEMIDQKIKEIKATGFHTLPVIITEKSDEKTYYLLKSKFTNAGIPCQVVTKDLLGNQYSTKYSLGNIGLQIFAKLGGKPWKMKPASKDYLIIGIGQSYNLYTSPEGTTVEKNIAYSVLTDSSGIFKDLQVLGEGVEDDNYWNQLTKNLVSIIKKSDNKQVAIHIPFRISKSKVLEKVAEEIDSDVELTVLVINDKNDYFGFDYQNNGLIPYESTFVKISKYDYLVWFEGLQAANPKITKRYSNPLLIKFWYSNQKELLDDISHRENLLQDCINLSGANWRGFKSKQLPVSVYYCQRIAEFIAKFREYNLDHIDINNLKPWFL